MRGIDIVKSHHKRTKGLLTGLRRIGYFAAFSALTTLALPVAAQPTDSAAILIHEASATTLGGPWQLIGVPPYQVQAEASPLLTLVLAQAEPNGVIEGSWTAGALLAGPQVAGRDGTFTTATHENDALRLTFTVGEPITAPMTLYLTPYGIGYGGSLSSGSMGISVVMWPDGHVPPTLAEMRLAVHGPAPSDFVDMTGSRALAPQDRVEAIAVCTDSPSGCPVTHSSSGISLTLPNNWSMSEPYFYETAGGARSDLPTATFFAEDFGNIIRVELNPRQWMESNGPCRSIGANQLCMFNGQGMGAEIGFEGIAFSLQVSPSGSDEAVARQ